MASYLGLTQKDINNMKQYIINPLRQHDRITIPRDDMEFYSGLKKDIEQYRDKKITQRQLTAGIGYDLMSDMYEDNPMAFNKMVGKYAQSYLENTDPIVRSKFIYNTLAASNTMKKLPLNAIQQITEFSTEMPKKGGTKRSTKRKTHKKRGTHRRTYHK